MLRTLGPPGCAYLALWQSDHFADVWLAQWLAFTPYELVKAHLNIDNRCWLVSRRKRRGGARLCPDNGDCMPNWVSPAEGWKSPQHPVGERYEH